MKDAVPMGWPRPYKAVIDPAAFTVVGGKLYFNGASGFPVGRRNG